MTIKPKEKQSQVAKLFSKFQAIINRTIAMINLIIVFVFTDLGLKVFSLKYWILNSMPDYWSY